MAAPKMTKAEKEAIAAEIGRLRDEVTRRMKAELPHVHFGFGLGSTGRKYEVLVFLMGGYTDVERVRSVIGDGTDLCGIVVRAG